MSQFAFDWPEITANGASTIITGRKLLKRIYARGSFSTGQLNIDISPNGIDFLPAVQQLSSAGVVPIVITQREFVRVRLVGGGGGISIFAFAR